METVQKPRNQLLSANTTTSQKSITHKTSTLDDAISLEKNQIIRGLVTDIRLGEITIRLVNKQTVVAHLEGTNEVSIGDVASFKILENKEGEITLYKLNSTISPEENTILKALEEANLPANTVNIEIVKELLYNQLPINKESINMILKQAMQFKNAQVSTLVYMNKNGLSLEESFIQNFEQVRNFDYRLLDNIHSAKEGFLQVMAQAANIESDASLISFSRQLLNLLSVQETTTTVNTQDYSSIHAKTDQNSIINLSGKDQSQLLQLFSSYDMPEDFMQSIENNSVNLRDMVHHITEVLTTVANTHPEQIAAFQVPIILSIMEQYGSLQQSNDEIASFLSTNQRMELLDAIQDFPLNISEAASIANGEINSSQLLGLISNHIDSEYTKSLRKLLGSEAFRKLISHQMNGEFCLTPENLKEEDGLEKYYSNVLDKMNKLKSLATAESIKTNPAVFQDKLDGVSASFDFMKNFNQLFTYVQLPVKLTNQITHGDLYVYTNKEKLRAGTDQISVLLHLDMDNLGPLDIHLTLTSSNLHGKFYVSDKDTKTLLTKHVEELRSALSEIGYSLNMEIYQQTKKIDILKDMREDESPATQIKRYSFDIRA